ncbi:MAG: NHLP bacteriocin system secretion protein [Nostoc sp.]|uniref:NHLP bacteriocin system secretion protein n=1 Tax=Nostoc sp. TaxID=1180 RepID=UPI002FFB81C5
MQETQKEDNPKKSLFRQEALDRISSPEQLDQLIQVVNPKAWIPLATIGTFLVVALVWSIFGRLPITVTGQAILLRPRRVVQFQSPSSGQLQTLNIQAGMEVKRGQAIGTIDQSQLQGQLRQQKEKLAALLSQTRERATLQQQQQGLQQRNLQQQRRILEKSLSDAQALAPVLREQGLNSIQKNRAGLTLRLSQLQKQLPVSQERVTRRESLLAAGAISQDTLLQVQQEYFDRVTQITDLEAQLQQLRLKELETQQQYLQNQTYIKQNQAQLEDLTSQEIKQLQQQKEQVFTDKNQVDEVKRQIAQLELQLSSQGKIVSPYDGRVLEVTTTPGQIIQAGSLIGSIQAENPAEPLVSLAFFPDRDGKQIQAGMAAQITPSTTKREQFGGIIGKVSDVTPYPVGLENVRAMVGNTELAQQLAGSSAPVQVAIQLTPDSTTFSGYQWSSSRGPQQNLSSGTTASVQVRTGEIAPIAYVIPLFRSWTGIY